MDGVKNGLIRRQKVLIWVSDPEEARELRDHISRLGWEVKYPERPVADPARYLKEFPVDVALLDIELKDMNLPAWGAACEEHRVPVVLIKTYDSSRPVHPSLKSARRIYKPIDGQSIRMTLTRAMQERSRNLIAEAENWRLRVSGDAPGGRDWAKL